MKKKKNTLLWKISKPGQEGDSYLFGTIHIWNREIEIIFNAVLPYLKACDLFAAESDLKDLENISTDFFQLREGQNLKDLYKPRKYKKLSNQLQKKFGIVADNVEMMSPFALYSSISKYFTETEQSSLDEKLWNYAISEGKIITGIETAKEQMAYYEQIPLQSQSELLYDLVMKSENFRHKFNRMLKDFLDMDIVSLYKSSKKGNKFFRKILVYRRNDLMSRRIAEMIPEQRCFIALGAGHLAGKRGILKQLKDLGFILKPINIKAANNK